MAPVRQPDALTAEEQRQVERWFVRHGVPHFIAGYGAKTDVFTRATPFLVLVFLGNIAGAFSDSLQGATQASAFLAAVALAFGAGAAVNRIRHRRPLQVPDQVGTLELAAFVVVPAVIHSLFADLHLRQGLLVAVVQLVVLGLTYLVVGYGLFPMTRWALQQARRQLSLVAHLMVRTLPLLLLFSTFLFLNAELWQVANDFTAPFFAVVAGFIVAVGIAFIALRVPAELVQLGRFGSWADVAAAAVAGPAPTRSAIDGQLPLPEAPLSRVQRINLGLLFVVGLGVQVVLVAMLIGLAYVVLGLFAVREETINQWTTGMADGDVWWRVVLFGEQIVLSRQLVTVAGFLTAFSGLQFAVSAVTDDRYRQEFLQEITDELRCALAVRVAYLARCPRTD